MALQELEALRSALLHHQASAAHEQELRLAAWRSDLSAELARQATALTESFSGAHASQQKHLEARLEASLALRVQEGLETLRGELAAVHSELRAFSASQGELRGMQSRHESATRTELDKQRSELAQLAESIRLASTALSGLGQESVTQIALDAQLEALRSEVARAQSGLEGHFANRLTALREEIGTARLAEVEGRLRSRVDDAQKDTQAQLAAVEWRLAQSRLELYERAELDSTLNTRFEASRRDVQTQIGSAERRLVEQVDQAVNRRCEALRATFEQELAAAQQRQQAQLRKVLAGAFQGHATQTLTFDRELRQQA